MTGILSRLTSAFPLWVLSAGVAALIRPDWFTWFSGPFITVGLGVIMLSMGMTLGFDDFRRVGRERARVLPGVVLQYTVMPALGWGLGYLFALPTPFAVGLVLVSCCPGGTASNVIAYLARADVALSVTLTALSTLLAVLMTPILTALLAGSRVDVPAAGLLLSTVQVVIVPVTAGALLKWRFPRAVDRVLPAAPLVAIVAISLIVGSVVGGGRERIIEAGPGWCSRWSASTPSASSSATSRAGSPCGARWRRARCPSRSACRTPASASCWPSRTSPTPWWRSRAPSPASSTRWSAASPRPGGGGAVPTREPRRPTRRAHTAIEEPQAMIGGPGRWSNPLPALDAINGTSLD